MLLRSPFSILVFRVQLFNILLSWVKPSHLATMSYSLRPGPATAYTFYVSLLLRLKTWSVLGSLVGIIISTCVPSTQPTTPGMSAKSSGNLVYCCLRTSRAFRKSFSALLKVPSVTWMISAEVIWNRYFDQWLLHPPCIRKVLGSNPSVAWFLWTDSYQKTLKVGSYCFPASCAVWKG